MTAKATHKTIWIVIACAVLAILAGCSVGLSVTDAVARDATEVEVRAAKAMGESASGTGRWTHLTVHIDRRSMGRIAWWELYSAIMIEDCATGENTNIIAVPEVEGVALDDPHAVKALLQSQPQKKVFRVTGLLFSRPGDWRRPQCARLDGGSFTFQKIASERVSIRFTGTMDPDSAAVAIVK